MVVFPVPSLCPKLCFSDILLWFWAGSLWSPTPNSPGAAGLWEELLSSLKEPQVSVWLCPQQSEWNCNFCSSNLFYLCFQSGLFPQSNPPSVSTQRKHSWRLWNRLICSWRWRGPAVDHWLVKTLSLHSCELSIKTMLPSLVSLRTECKIHLFDFALLKYPASALRHTSIPTELPQTSLSVIPDTLGSDVLISGLFCHPFSFTQKFKTLNNTKKTHSTLEYPEIKSYCMKG